MSANPEVDVTLLAYPPRVAAQKLGRSVATLAMWRSLGIGPAFARSPEGRSVWYTDKALMQFLHDQEVKELARRMISQSSETKHDDESSSTEASPRLATTMSSKHFRHARERKHQRGDSHKRKSW